MFLLRQAAILIVVLLPVDTLIYLSHTHDGTEVEFFDCLYAGSLWYCRRPTLAIKIRLLVKRTVVSDIISLTFDRMGRV